MEGDRQIIENERIFGGELSCQESKARELASYLLGSSADSSDVHHGFVQWFNELVESMKESNENSLYQQYRDDRKLLDGEKSLIVPRLLMILRECALSHRWNEVLKILHAVVREPKDTFVALWKVGLHLLYLDPDGNSALIGQLVNQLKYLSDLNCKEVILEYVFHLLDTGGKQEAKQMIQNIPRSHAIKPSREHKQYIDMLLIGYTGLIWYVEWLDNRQKLYDQDSLDTQGVTSNPLSSNREFLMKMCAQRAISQFSKLEGEPGVWDIFITKQVQLLEYSEEMEQAQRTLKTYVENNPENPNAHKYLYSFRVRNGAEEEEEIKLLKTLADCVDSDPLVLRLCSLLQKDSQISAVSYLFKLLDYPCWQLELSPWKMLADTLQSILINRMASDEEMEVIGECWKVRQSWWPVFHFTSHQVGLKGDPNGSELDFHKAVVASILCGEDNHFVLETLKKLDFDHVQKLSIIQREKRKFNFT
ncbi:hypothetical protein CHS0354_004052 [Potamilus streckersoni]|uniref:TATA box-binding protein-associated factor RNA polymerase I subunit A n=1 Tax=Potamilus streckersoni TaxID=2493646 RepID=A0AAE0T8A7_9BIVA|nr:hypothetical protein CHS0354_004052 [Potamilus streckersoni]